MRAAIPSSHATRRTPGLLPAALAVLALSLPAPPAARGALIECPPIASTPGAKLVVGAIRPSGGAAGTVSGFEERRIRNAISQQVHELRAEKPELVETVLCAQRFPDSPQELTVALSRNLLDQDVLLEIWGESEQQLALVHFAVLAVRARGGAPPLPGIYPSSYEFDATGGLAALFREAHGLKSFTALAIGMHALDEARAQSASGQVDPVAWSTRFNDARHYLCEAERLLREASTAGDELGPDPQQWQALIGLVGDTARDVVDIARTNPAYVGTLKVVPLEMLERCDAAGG